MQLETRDHRFPAQHTDHDGWVKATRASAAADAYFGHRAPVQHFLAGRAEPELQQLHADLERWTPAELQAFVAQTKGQSLSFIVMMLTGACNANCTICFTDRRRRVGETTPEQRDQILREAAALGARYVYVPGEGEPTIDAGFWQFLESCRAHGLEALVFTNGILLSDEAACRRYWKTDPQSAVRRLREYPVSFYFKYWSAQPELVGDMMQIDPDQYHFTEYDGMRVPAGLVRLIEGFPRERVGIEVVVERRNADEVVDAIVPFAERNGLSRIVEMIQHNGRVLDSVHFDPTPEQVERAAPLLSPTSCAMAPVKAVVTSRGMLSPRIAVLEHQIPGQPVHAASGPLFELLRSEYLANLRYDVVNCLCETLPAELSCAATKPAASVTVNVAPAWLDQPVAAPAAGGCGSGACACKNG